MQRSVGLGWVIAAGLCVAPGVTSGETVVVEGGRLEGTTSAGVARYLGIPFAAPPVGANRWRAPQPVPAWNGVRDASRYRADCMQESIAADAAPVGTTPAEDCLYLNVWAPSGLRVAPRPVLVWIYGGGLVNGGASPPTYALDAFARAGLVAVSFNYRLGRFGFFAHPAILAEAGEAPSVNFGVLDAIAAVEWVQRNAARFGGDPARVTIMAESAGGGLVLALMTSPLTRERGLFHRAILQSAAVPGAREDQMPLRSLDSARALSLDYARSLGIDGEGAAALRALRALPAATLARDANLGTSVLLAVAGIGPKGLTGPILDGRVFVETPEAALRSGRIARVPVIVGANDLEIGLGFELTKDALFAAFGPAASAARAAYDPAGTTPLAALLQPVFGDRAMAEPARFLAQSVSATGQPAWYYRFAYVAEHLRTVTPGAPHASEIPYVMNTIEARYGARTTDADRAMARAVHTLWANFARDGDPNAASAGPGAGAQRWPPFDVQHTMLEVRNDGRVAAPDPWRARLDATAAAIEAGLRTPNPRITPDRLSPELLQALGLR